MYEQYYKILGLKPGASNQDIKKVYRLLAKKYHPDINPSPFAHEQFTAIAEAYEVLSSLDPLKVKRSDPEDMQTYEYYIKMAREKARQAAQMRYEKLRREHEAFRESGLYDLSILFSYVQNILIILFTLFLLAFPVYLVLKEKTFVMFFLWIPGIFLLFYLKDKRKTLFRPGPFFYSFKDLIRLVRSHSSVGPETCTYCSDKKADSVSYRINMLKVSNIQLDFIGGLWHQARYKREYTRVNLPRSKKAFHIHSLVSMLKISIIIVFLILLPVDSLICRLIAGIITAGLLATLILLLTRTKSKVSYLLNRLMVTRIICWLVIVLLVTDIRDFPNIRSTDYTAAGVVIWLFLQELFIEPVSRIFFRKDILHKPLFRQPVLINRLVEQGYQNYFEIPVWSTIFPLIKWLF